MMTSRERQTRCFNHQEIDRPAVYSRTGYPENDPSYDTLKKYMQEHSDLRINFSARRIAKDGEGETFSERIGEDAERVTEVIHTPKGDLTASTIHINGRKASYQDTYFIKCREDAERYLSLPLPDFSVDAEEFHRLDRAMGDRGIVCAYLGTVPGGRIAELCGSETLGYMTVDDRELLHEICIRELHIMLEKIKLLVSCGTGPFFAMQGEEYIVPPLHGPGDFRDFVVRYDTPIIELIHNAGGLVHIHCHGSIGKMLDAFVQMGTDVLHPVEAPPMGDVTAAQAKMAFRGKVCVEGNIQISRMYENTPEEIAMETGQLIRDAFDDRSGLIVSPTASPYIFGEGGKAFPQYKAMIDTVIQWK